MSSHAPHVLLFEPLASGHRYHYASLILAAVSQSDCRVTFATNGDSLETSEYKTHLADQNIEFELLKMQTTKARGGLKNSIAMTNQLCSAIDNIKPDHVLIPTAGPLSQGLNMKSLFGKSPLTTVDCEGLFFGRGFGYDWPKWRQKKSVQLQMFLDRRLPWATYAHIDPFQLEVIRAADHKTRGDTGDSSKYLIMPDPSPAPIDISPDDARRELGIPVDGRYIGMAGGISFGKGSLDLLDAFRRAVSQLSTTDRLLLAGRVDGPTRTQLNANFESEMKSQRIVLLDRYLEKREMALAFASMDIMVAAQRDRPGSSGTVIRAVTQKIPLLARDRFWVARVVQQFGLGWTCDTRDANAFAGAIVSSLNSLSGFHWSSASERFANFHSEENFQATWVSKLCQKAARQPPHQRLSWDQVIGQKSESESVSKSEPESLV